MSNMLLIWKPLLLASLHFISTIGFTQVTEKWVKRQNGDANTHDIARDLVIDCKGNIIVTGLIDGNENLSNTNWATIKYNDDGDTKWVKKYKGPGNGDDEATAITTDNNGNIYVTGWSTGIGTSSDFTTIKYDDDGDIKWVRRYNGPGNSSDEAFAIAVDADGNVYITGRSTGSGTAEDITTIKYDEDGHTEWIRRYNGPGNERDQPTAIAVDKKGNVYVTGWSAGIGTGSDITTIKYDDDGDLKWVSRYNGPVNEFDRANDLALDENGNVYVTGSITTHVIEDFGIISDIATIKYNTLGQQQWLAVFSREGHDEGNALAVDAAGNVYIGGITGSAPGNPDNDYVTIKYNTAGVQQWEAFLEGTGNDENSLVHDLLLDKTGNVYITGALSVRIVGVNFFINETDYATVKYNSNGVQQWAATYDGPGNASDIAFAMGLDNNGNIYVTGRSAIDRFDFATIKYDADGEQEWLKRYNGQNVQVKGGPDFATALALDKHGNVHVTGGITRLHTGMDYTTYKYDPDANRIWKKTYNGLGVGPDKASAIAVDAKGNVYITGTSDGGGTRDDYTTVKYDKYGDTKWVRRYNGPGNSNDQATAIAVDENGNVYVTGLSFGNSPDYATIKYDNSGNTIWIKRYNGPGNTSDQATAIAVDIQGNVYITGHSQGSGSESDYATIKYDANGNEQWTARYNGPDNYLDEANALALDANGNVYVTGGSWGGGTEDFATIKYNTAGVLQWVARYDGSTSSGFDKARDIAVDVSGNVYVTGQSQGDYTTIKYNTAGVQQWLAAYNNGSEDIANALALDARGNVYVTGSSRSTNGFFEDYATIKYNAAGLEQWVARYDGPGHTVDIATAIAVDDDGHVYVTGHSSGDQTFFDGSSSDYATIKYEQTPGNERISQPVITNSDLPASFQVTVAPNPAAVATKIFYELPFEGRVIIQVFDLLGRQITTLTDATKPAGFHNEEFNVTTLQKGIYVYRIKVKTEKTEWSQTGKLKIN
ncbi:SBBP repeat-containing protein [Longitalea luteola]|uniref:SBBP repeat-containing protein n=1 Tax=Longitalea luteola TaxID=2812563 RepID=UPI001A96BEFB|nr:SBBP repeat-containing protein [Longitalea luteola]